MKNPCTVDGTVGGMQHPRSSKQVLRVFEPSESREPEEKPGSLCGPLGAVKFRRKCLCASLLVRYVEMTMMYTIYRIVSMCL